MLPLEDGGVVDPQLKVNCLFPFVPEHILIVSFQVYGTKNLRVADLSVVPLHIAAHMQGQLIPGLRFQVSMNEALTPCAPP